MKPSQKSPVAKSWPPKPWRTNAAKDRFGGKLGVIAWEAGLALLVVIAVADLPQSAQARLYGLLLSPVVFLVVLGALFLVTRKKSG